MIWFDFIDIHRGMDSKRRFNLLVRIQSAATGGVYRTREPKVTCLSVWPYRSRAKRSAPPIRPLLYHNPSGWQCQRFFGLLLMRWPQETYQSWSRPPPISIFFFSFQDCCWFYPSLIRVSLNDECGKWIREKKEEGERGGGWSITLWKKVWAKPVAGAECLYNVID